jgi:hypothetical protein
VSDAMTNDDHRTKFPNFSLSTKLQPGGAALLLQRVTAGGLHLREKNASGGGGGGSLWVGRHGARSRFALTHSLTHSRSLTHLTDIRHCHPTIQYYFFRYICLFFSTLHPREAQLSSAQLASQPGVLVRVCCPRQP